MSEIKYFNRVYIWGRLRKLEELKTKNSKPYVDIQVDCSSGIYGNVRAFCRLWSKNKIVEFIEAYKVGHKVKLTGLLSQYDGRKEGVIKTVFTVFDVERWDPERDQHKDARAVFILVAGLLDTEKAGDETKVTVVVKGRNKEEEDNEFVLYLPTARLLEIPDLVKGSVYSIKGAIKQEVDEFGEMIKAARPVVMEVKLRGEEVPF